MILEKLQLDSDSPNGSGREWGTTLLVLALENSLAIWLQGNESKSARYKPCP